MNCSAIKSLGSLFSNLINEIRSLIPKDLVDTEIPVNANFLFKNDFKEILALIVSILIILPL